MMCLCPPPPPPAAIVTFTLGARTWFKAPSRVRSAWMSDHFRHKLNTVADSAEEEEEEDDEEERGDTQTHTDTGAWYRKVASRMFLRWASGLRTVTCRTVLRIGQKWTSILSIGYENTNPGAAAGLGMGPFFII